MMSYRNRVTLCWLCLICLCTLSVWQRTFAQETAEQSQDLFLAEKAFADGFYEIALTHFQKYQEKYPDTNASEIQMSIGRCYLNLDKNALALHTFQKIQEKGKDDACYVPAIYWTAQTYFAARDYDNAEKIFARIVEQYPQTDFLAQSYFYRASCYYQTQKFAQALKFYQEFISRFCEHDLAEESAFRIAQCFYNLKDYATAHKEFASFMKTFPQSNNRNSAFYYLGEIEYRQGNFTEAVQYDTEAAQINPKSKIAALARYCRGWAYLKLNEYEQALDEFKNLEELPDFIKGLEDAIIFAQGRCYVAIKDYLSAIRQYERIINDFPRSSWFDDAYFWKGQALGEQGSYAEAAQIYEEAIKKFLKQELRKEEAQLQAIYEQEDLSVNLMHNLRYNLGWTYARMKKYAEAIVQFEQVYEDSQERLLKSGAICRIGDIYLEQENYAKAVEYYDRVLSDFPDSYYSDYAQYQLGVALSREAKFASAIMAFGALSTNFPQSQYLDEAHYQIGSIYFRQGLFSQCAAELENLVKTFPKTPLQAQAIFLCGLAYYNNQDYPRAQNKFLEVLRVSKDTSLKIKAQYQIGFCLYQSGKEEKAAAELERFLTLYPDSGLTADVLFWLGHFYYRKNKFDQAQKDFTTLIEKFPRSELADDAAFWQAKILFGLQTPEPALVKLQALQTDYPNSDIVADALLLQGDIFREQGKKELAKEAYEKVCLKFNGTDFARLGHQKMGKLLQEEALFAQAIQQYQQALGAQDDDFNAQVQFTVAECRESEEDLSQALDEYLKVVYLYPEACGWVARAQLGCARILERQGQVEEAKAIYERLAEGNTPEAELARQRLKKPAPTSP